MVDYVQAPISIGELIDKITILEIKVAEFTDGAKIANARTELDLLAALRDTALPAGMDLEPLTQELKTVNREIWDLEDAIRECERLGRFGEHFIEIARTVHRTNDRRAAIKRRINLAVGSRIIEEQSHRIEDPASS